MESRFESTPRLSPEEIQKKFNNLKKLLNVEIPLHSDNNQNLMPTVEVLYHCRQIKYELDCYIHTQLQQQAIKNLHELIYQSRLCIQEKISHQTVDELKVMTIDLGRERNNTLLEFLAEIGEVHLFKQLHLKLADNLHTKDYLYIYSILRKAYRGIGLSESLGLAFNDLTRGSTVYIQMIREFAVSLKHDPDFLNLFIEVMGRKPMEQKNISNTVFVKKDNFIKYKVNFFVDDFSECPDLIFNYDRKKIQLEELHKEYVEFYKQLNLMDEFESNYFSIQSQANPYGFLSSTSSVASDSSANAKQSIEDFTTSCITM